MVEQRSGVATDNTMPAVVNVAWLAATADQLVRQAAAGQLPYEQAISTLSGCAGRNAFTLREAVPLVHADAAVALLHEAAMEADEPLGDSSTADR